jgi:hypothetical protein
MIVLSPLNVLEKYSPKVGFGRGVFVVILKKVLVALQTSVG